MDVLDGRFRQQACDAPGPTEGVRNTVGKVSRGILPDPLVTVVKTRVWIRPLK